MISRILIFLSMFFLFYDNFPFDKLNLGSPKPISLLFLGIYFVLNFKGIIKNKYSRFEKNTLLFLWILVLISISKGWVEYKSLENSFKFFNEIISLNIIYCSLKHIFTKGKIKIENILKIILYGYCFNNLFGIIQLIYINTKSSSLMKFLEIFTSNTNHIENGRIQFLFGEPSFISTHITVIIIPILIYYYKNKLQLSNFIKLNLLIMLLLSLKSGSLRVFLDIFIVILIIISIINFKNIFKISIILAPTLILFLLLTPKILNKYSDNLVVMRISNIIDKTSTVTDYSLWARKDYSLVGFYSICEKPILGYGGGYYNISYKENIYKVDPYYYYNPELIRNVDAEYLNSINMYARFCSEFGIIGAIFLIIFIITFLLRIKDKFYIAIFVTILYNWIQNDSLVLITNLFWICYLNNIKYIKKEGDINENNSFIN